MNTYDMRTGNEGKDEIRTFPQIDLTIDKALAKLGIATCMGSPEQDLLAHREMNVSFYPCCVAQFEVVGRQI
jgi:hypothetical protein